MAVKAKFQVNRIEQQYAGDAHDEVDGRYVRREPREPIVYPTVVMKPVYAPDDDGHENHRFWQASPSGELTMQINNPDAAEHFQAGDLYYLTFEKAE